MQKRKKRRAAKLCATHSMPTGPIAHPLCPLERGETETVIRVQLKIGQSSGREQEMQRVQGQSSRLTPHPMLTRSLPETRPTWAP